MENYDAAFAAVGLGVYAFSLIISLAVTVLVLVAQWKLFVKAGKPGWACLIPFYNMYCLFDIASLIPSFSELLSILQRQMKKETICRYC